MRGREGEREVRSKKQEARWVTSGLFLVATFLLLSIVYFPAPSGAANMEGTTIEEELKTLKKEIEDLRKDVEDLKAKGAVRQPLRPQEPPEVVVSINDDPVKGNTDAPIAIIEFSDYQCPFCARFFKTTLPEIERDYIKTGKVKYIFRDFPLDFHKDAPKASEAANCAGEQGKYWEMHDRLFENQGNLKIDRLKQHAVEMGIDSSAFDSCLDSGKYTTEIEKDVEDGRRAGVGGTPSFFIGRTQGASKEIKAKKVVGARPYTAFKQVIEQLLEEEK